MKDSLFKHYVRNWHGQFKERHWLKGPHDELPEKFCVLEFAPSDADPMWRYATCCMSIVDDPDKVELHVFSTIQSEEIVELLTVVAHFHRTDGRLGVGHTVNFGRGWLENSLCEHGLISLPYLDGPNLEIEAHGINCYWLIPVTKAEVEYKKARCLEALEALFEKKHFNYLDPNRMSVV